MNELQNLIAEIRETGRMHQALLNAEGRLSRQIKAIEKRFNDSIGEAGQFYDDNQQVVASHSDPTDLGEGGHDVVDSRKQNAALSTITSDAGHERSVDQPKDAGAATLQDAAGQHKGDRHIMIAGGVDHHGGTGQEVLGHRENDACAANPQGNVGQVEGDGHDEPAGVAALFGGTGQCAIGTQPSGAGTATLSGDDDHTGSAHLKDIVELATLPLTEAKKPIHKQQLALRRRLEALAKQLPAWEFVDGVHGFGAFGFAMIVCEAGDLGNYATHSRLWKRMGLAVIDGRAQRKVANAEEAERQGYNPRRRSLMHNVGDSLVKKQNAYRDLYLARKEHEEDQLPNVSKMYRHLRSLRYMEKRLLRDLWRAWRDATQPQAQVGEAA